MPCHIGGYAHIIPLIVLSCMLDDRSFEKVFFLSKHAKDHYEPFYQKYNIRVSRVDADGTILAAAKACEAFAPDVIVDDFSYTAGFLRQLNGLPRVTIQRTGSFPHESRIESGFVHSSGLDEHKLPKRVPDGLVPPRSIADLFDAEAKVVPGVRSAEVLPERLKQDRTYSFCGPLLLSDIEVTSALRLFLDKNKNRKKVYVTYGSAQKPPEEIIPCLQQIAERDIAIITNVESEELAGAFPDSYYYEGYLPMNFVCSQADIVIHHCGNATYHYPIMHLKRTIVLGTGCYDREIVALRLRDLQVAHYVPSPKSTTTFGKKFQSAFERVIHEGRQREVDRVERQKALLSEIKRTKNRFSFHDILSQAVRFNTVSSRRDS